MKHYLTLALARPKELYKARTIKKGQITLVLALLVLVITLANLFRLLPIIHSIQSDGQEIANELPAFTVTEDTLTSEESESYIHQTDSFLLFFDPNDQFQKEEIDSNIERLQVPIGIGLLKNTLYFNVAGVEMDYYYEQMQDFDQSTVKEIFNTAGNATLLTYLFGFLFAYIGIALMELMDLLIILLFANLFSRAMRSGLSFKENMKLAILASLLPTLVLEATSLFGVVPPYYFELKIILSLFLFYLTIKEMKKKQVS